MLDHAPDDVFWLEGEQAWHLLHFFGIQAGAAHRMPVPAAAERALLEVRSDPSFGPLICLSRAGKPPVVRITPLTDQDVREYVEIVELPAGCGVEELLGRISQMIEELPWLCGMQAEIYRTLPDPASCRVVLDPNVRIGFCHHG